MKITPVASPHQIVQAQTTNNSSARDKAIAILTQSTPAPQTQQTAPTTGNAQETAVANPNKISAEEVSAVRAPAKPEPAQVIDTPTQSVDTKAEAKPEKDPVVTKQFEELARQERIWRAKVQKQAQEIKAQEAALNEQKALLEERTKLYEQGYISKDALKRDPLGALSDVDLTYDELTQRALRAQQRDPVIDNELKALREEIKSLRSQNEDNTKAQVQERQEAYQQAVSQIRNDVRQLVASDEQSYEAISKTGSVEDVVELITRNFDENKVLLSVEEAAEKVESYLVDQLINTTSRIEKAKKRLAQAQESKPQIAQAKEDTAKKEETTPSTMKTLTNAASSSRKLSARERAIARATGFKGDF